MGKGNWLRSASWIAVATAGALSGTQAQAQETAPVLTPTTPWYSVEGGFVFGEAGVDKLGESGPGDELFDLSTDNPTGGYGAVAIGREFTPYWDWRIGLGATLFKEEEDDFSVVLDDSPIEEFGAKGMLESDLDFVNADFDLGYHLLMSPSHNLRLFAGGRILWSEESVDFSGGYFGTDSEDDFGEIGFMYGYSTSYLGIGPRIGAEASTRFGGANGRFGLSGLLAGSAVFGSRDINFYTGEYCIEAACGGEDDFDSDRFGASETENDTIFNLEGAVGADFYFGDYGKLTVGYRAQQWWGLRESVNATEDKLGVDDDVLVHGPFLKYTNRF